MPHRIHVGFPFLFMDYKSAYYFKQPSFNLSNTFTSSDRSAHDEDDEDVCEKFQA